VALTNTYMHAHTPNLLKLSMRRRSREKSSVVAIGALAWSEFDMNGAIGRKSDLKELIKPKRKQSLRVSCIERGLFV
jgi:hypothetical protein